MTKHFLSLLFIIAGITCLFSQNPERIYQSHSEENGIFSVTTNDGKYLFKYYSTEILETTFIPKGEVSNTISHAVIIQPKKVETTYKYIGNDITYSSEGLSVIVTTEPFKISYSYNNNPLISEKRGYYKSTHESMELVKDHIIAELSEKIEFNLSEDEVLYGGGSRALGMNRRGYRLPLYNRAQYGYQSYAELLNYTLPVVLSSKKYLLHFDNSTIGYLDLDSKRDNTLSYETLSGRKTYQIIAGNSWYDVVENYTELTGKQPMLPRWTLGNFSSRFGYHSQKETLETIDKFKKEEIPVDAVIIDLYWFGEEIQGTLGNFEFYRDSFPEPKQMVDILKSQNIETTLITEPYVLKTSKRWDEAVKQDILAKDSIGNPAVFEFYFGKGGIIDIFKPKGERWFKDIYTDLSEFGVNGFWGDLGEPEELPNWVNFETGSADELHNIYGHNWAKLVYEASLESNPSRRPFVLMRAGYSGSQRYGMIPWTGDVSRSWGGLKPQPEIALQMGMQGIAYMHSDLGGFAGANLDDELYARWLQYGVFQPIFRPHADETLASEPVYRSEKAKKLANFAIQMRYRMLPYNYHLMVENHVEGRPLMRPLFFEEPDNKDLFEYSGSYLWGNDILVSPVLEAGKKIQEVYFPKGSMWFDIENDEAIEGGQTKTVALNESFIPVYVRGGSFIPLAKPMQSTKEYDDSYLQVQYYYDVTVTKSQRHLYMDDGTTTNNIVNEAYQILKFDADIEDSWLDIEFESDNGKNYEAKSKTIDLTIHNLIKKPKQIKIGKDKVNGTYNSENKTLTLNLNWDTNKEKQVRIKLRK
ncbi:TIM-barrel domain-containing protein [Winogradskyella sp. A2]|uniref:TIM-barrel domain-containing protein n=1 Tax=Winogradskyella sp. A2 TaxID=3366944 RepID=UPI00398C2D75